MTLSFVKQPFSYDINSPFGNWPCAAEEQLVLRLEQMAAVQTVQV